MTKRERIVKSVLAHVPKDAINQFISRGSTPVSVLLIYRYRRHTCRRCRNLL